MYEPDEESFFYVSLSLSLSLSFCFFIWHICDNEDDFERGEDG